MIGNWRTYPPPQQAPQRPPPKPRILERVTADKAANIQKAAETTNTLVTSMIDQLPPEQQSAFKNYRKTREESGSEARKNGGT